MASQALDFFVLVCDLPVRKRIDDWMFGVFVYHTALVLYTLRDRLSGEYESQETLVARLRKVVVLMKESAETHVLLQQCVCPRSASSVEYSR